MGRCTSGVRSSGHIVGEIHSSYPSELRAFSNYVVVCVCVLSHV